MKYRKKPVVIEAVQFKDDAKALTKLSDWMGGTIKIAYTNPENPVLKIETLKGTMQANVSDWIIKGVKGEFYLIKNYIFLETYEKVD